MATPTTLARIDVKIGENIKFEFQPMTVIDTNHSQITLKNRETDLVESLTWDKFRDAYFKKKVVFEERVSNVHFSVANDNINVPFELLPNKEQECARRRFAYAEGVRKKYPGVVSNSDLKAEIARIAQEIEDHRPVKPRRVRDYLKTYDNAGGVIDAFISRESHRGPNGPRAHPLVMSMISDAIERVFRRKEKVTVSDAELEAGKSLKKHNDGKLPGGILALPSDRTIRRYVNKRMCYALEQQHLGKKALKHKYAPTFQRHYNTTRPLEVVEMDSHMLDLKLKVGSEEVKMRCWIILAIDVHTRMVVGFHLTLGNPDANGAVSCLLNMMQPKDKVLEPYDSYISGFWPCFGKPRTIVVDNGSEFLNNQFMNACARLGIAIIWCEAGEPEQKPHVERFFGTLNTQLNHKIPGTTMSNPDQLEAYDYDSDANARFRVEEYKRIITKYLVDIYHKDFHEGLEDIPYDVWTEGVKKYPVTLPPSADQLAVLMDRIETRTMTKKGIKIESLTYNSEELAALRNGRTGIKAKLRFNEGELSRIYVFNDKTGGYFEVPSTNLEKTIGLTWEKHLEDREKVRTKRKMAKGSEQRQEDRIALYDTIHRSEDDVDVEQSSQPKASKRCSPEVVIHNAKAMTPPSGSDYSDLYGANDDNGQETEEEYMRRKQRA